MNGDQLAAIDDEQNIPAPFVEEEGDAELGEVQPQPFGPGYNAADQVSAGGQGLPASAPPGSLPSVTIDPDTQKLLETLRAGIHPQPPPTAAQNWLKFLVPLAAALYGAGKGSGLGGFAQGWIGAEAQAQLERDREAQANLRLASAINRIQQEEIQRQRLEAAHQAAVQAANRQDLVRLARARDREDQKILNYVKLNKDALAAMEKQGAVTGTIPVGLDPVSGKEVFIPTAEALDRVLPRPLDPALAKALYPELPPDAHPWLHMEDIPRFMKTLATPLLLQIQARAFIDHKRIDKMTRAELEAYEPAAGAAALRLEEQRATLGARRIEELTPAPLGQEATGEPPLPEVFNVPKPEYGGLSAGAVFQEALVAIATNDRNLAAMRTFGHASLQSDARIRAIMNKKAAILNLSGRDAPEVWAAYRADANGLSFITRMNMAATTFANQAKGNLMNALRLVEAGKVPITDAPKINQLLQDYWYRPAVGHPGLTQLDNYIFEAVRDYARATTAPGSSAQMPVDALKKAERLFQASFNVDQFRAAAEAMIKGLDVATGAYQNAIQTSRAQIRELLGPPGTGITGSVGGLDYRIGPPVPVAPVPVAPVPPPPER